MQPGLQLRSPWQSFAASILSARRRWWTKRQLRLPKPVISVGNLHLGGTGKTPLTIALARRLRDAGLHVVILSRGYKRRSRGVVCVSQGSGPLLDWKLAGDEPWMMAKSLEGVGIWVGERRYQAGRAALAESGKPVDLFLLDDGFSHLRLARDLDLLVFPKEAPLGGGRLAPGGRLREPLGAVAAAQAAILVNGDGDSRNQLDNEIRRHQFTGSTFLAATEPSIPKAPAGRVVLVTGIANPERVRESAEAVGLEVALHLSFPDHHPFSQGDLDRIRLASNAEHATVVTTAKDCPKLEAAFPDLAILELRSQPESAFWRWLEAELSGLDLSLSFRS